MTTYIVHVFRKEPEGKLIQPIYAWKRSIGTHLRYTKRSKSIYRTPRLLPGKCTTNRTIHKETTVSIK